jgi:hypothetical protein
LKKGAPLFYIPFNGMELRFLGCWRIRLRRAAGRRWRRGREYKKVDQNEETNEKRP